MACRMALQPLTLSEAEGHFCYLKPLYYPCFNYSMFTHISVSAYNL